MGKIRVMSDALASQVAAGEVVERPASVLKELVENSIDAGARHIDVELRRAGISSIVVRDDGEGMSRSDALLSIERHATSKLHRKEELERIHSLGFRGEALPSIASVSRFQLETRQPEEVEGTEVVIHGGKLLSVKEKGMAPGTRIEVRSLFYNIPARRKFLRTENTEFKHLEQQFLVQAIAHPEISFRLVKDEKLVYHLPKTDDLLERIRHFVGSDLSEKLIAVEDREHPSIQISGYVGRPGISRSRRQLQLFFLNGRAVENSQIQYALREAYHTALMKGTYPVSFLFLELDPAQVDVNVHPAKREVRLRNGREVVQRVVEVVRRALAEKGGHGLEVSSLRGDLTTFAKAIGTPRPSPILGRSPESRAEEFAFLLDATAAPGATTAKPWREQSGVEEKSVVSEEEPSVALEEASPWRFLGVLAKLYLLFENRDGLVLVDQHAAHERVLFEKLRRQVASGEVPSQKLLLPMVQELSPRDFERISEYLPLMQKMGLGVDIFGKNSIRLESLPAMFKVSDYGAFLDQLCAEIEQIAASGDVTRLSEEVIATTVCRHAIKANDCLHEREVERLMTDLWACEFPHTCPHGRPTFIEMGFAELEKRFGRLVH